MEKEQAQRLEFYGGPLVGFLPTLMYVIVAVFLGLNFQYYSINAIAYGGAIGLILVSFLAKNQQTYWKTVAGGVKGLLINVFLFIVLGLFITFLTKGDLGGGLIWIGGALGLEGGAFVVLGFLASALVTMGTGTPLLGLLTILPLFFPSGVALGANETILAGAILSGCFFGDHVSPSSQVTIIASQTQTDEETGEAASPIELVKSRLPYAAGAALISLVVFYFFGGSADGAGDVSILQEMSNPSGLWMLVALAVVLLIAFKTGNVLYGLVMGVVAASILGLVTGLFTFSDFLYYQPETAEMAGIIPEGVMYLAGFLVSLIFLYCIIEVMNKSGAIDVLTEWLATFSFMQTPLGVELVSAVTVMIGTVLLSGMVIPAILIVSSLMNRLGPAAGLDKTRRTNILIVASTSISPLIPISSVYLNGTVGDVAGLQRLYPFIETISPFTTFFSSIYNWIILAIVLVWIFAGVGRKSKKA